MYHHKPTHRQAVTEDRIIKENKISIVQLFGLRRGEISFGSSEIRPLLSTERILLVLGMLRVKSQPPVVPGVRKCARSLGGNRWRSDFLTTAAEQNRSRSESLCTPENPGLPDYDRDHYLMYIIKETALGISFRAAAVNV